MQQDTSMQKNKFYFYTLPVTNLKRKLRKQFYFTIVVKHTQELTQEVKKNSKIKQNKKIIKEIKEYINNW